MPAATLEDLYNFSPAIEAGVETHLDEFGVSDVLTNRDYVHIKTSTPMVSFRAGAALADSLVRVPGSTVCEHVSRRGVLTIEIRSERTKDSALAVKQHDAMLAKIHVAMMRRHAAQLNAHLDHHIIVECRDAGSSYSIEDNMIDVTTQEFELIVEIKRSAWPTTP